MENILDKPKGFPVYNISKFNRDLVEEICLVLAKYTNCDNIVHNKSCLKYGTIKFRKKGHSCQVYNYPDKVIFTFIGIAKESGNLLNFEMSIHNSGQYEFKNLYGHLDEIKKLNNINMFSNIAYLLAKNELN